MADNTTIHIGENSPEKIAHALFLTIASVEGRILGGVEDARKARMADRKYILDTYAECLAAVRGYRTFPSQNS